VDEASLSRKEQFLARLRIFAELSGEELADLALIAREYTFEEGAVIAYQRDLAEAMIIVYEGRLYASHVDEQGLVRDSYAYETGEYFEDVWLFKPGTHWGTVKGSGDGHLLMIGHDDFVHFLHRHPEAIGFLVLSDEAAQVAEGTLVAEETRRFKGLGLVADEIVEYFERRSGYLLIFRVAWPILVYLFWVALVNLVMEPGSTLAIVASVIPGLALLIFLAIQILDWSNDYFVVTNKHLIHREFDLRRMRTRVVKVPIDQVQSVEILKPSLLATILNTGSARITTASQFGVLVFDFIDHPREVKNIINTLRQQVKAVDAGRELATMRSAIEEYFQAAPAYTEIERPAEADAGEPVQRRNLWDIIRRAVSSRVVEGDTVTYRKHFFVLFRKLIILGLVDLALFAGLVLVTDLTLAVILLGLWIIGLGWLIWRFEDWRNDTFRVDSQYVLDIDRRPFGFGESRKQAELGNVQNVNSVRPGLLPTLFNYGNVIIETAGATADITFENVVNPNHIQSDIFERRDAFRRQQHIRDGVRRRREYAVLLDVYQQAQEQGRIPGRTPGSRPEEQA
jgi:hypothetical protein